MRSSRKTIRDAKSAQERTQKKRRRPAPLPAKLGAGRMTICYSLVLLMARLKPCPPFGEPDAWVFRVTQKSKADSSGRNGPRNDSRGGRRWGKMERARATRRLELRPGKGASGQSEIHRSTAPAPRQ